MKLKDTNIFFLPGNPHMLHIATIQNSLSEYIAMLDVRTQKLYIEEVVLECVDYSKDVYANLKFISDDNLASELAQFCQDKKIIDMKKISEVVLDRKILSPFK